MKQLYQENIEAQNIKQGKKNTTDIQLSSKDRKSATRRSICGF